MFTLAPEYAVPQSARLVVEQFRHCGFLYASRKYLKLSLLLKFSAHLSVTRSLALPQTRPLLNHHPKAAFKYLRKYLAHSFDLHSRSIILSSHYHYLSNLVVMDFIDRICRGAIPLWEEEIDGNQYGINLTYPKNEEGELFLVFTENAAPLFTLSFTIAPGRLFNVADEQVIFIGRLQGTANQKEAINRASKSFHDLPPAALLLAATRGIAASLNIAGMVGVSARNQVCLRGARLPDTAASAYDEFWTSAGGEKLNEQFYYLPVTQTEKPLSLVKNNHRSRVKRKRQLKHSLMNQVSLAFNMKCLSPTTGAFGTPHDCCND